MKDFAEFSGPMVNWPRVEAIDDIEESLAIISSYFITCLASNAGSSDAKLMGLALERVGIRDYFNYLFTSKELGYKKPDPNFYKEITARLGVNPSECIMIGNDYEKDIVPSKMVGMKTILYSETIIEGTKQFADYIIKSMNEIVDLAHHEIDYEKLWYSRCKSMHKKLNDDLDYYIDIRTVSKATEKSNICELVLRNLPQWFGIEESIKEYVNGVKDEIFLSAYVGDIPIGFLSIKDHNKFTSEIYVLGILKEFHGKGIGKKLIKAAEDILVKQDKKFLTVKTLGDSHPDENYKKTKKFYSAMGFYPLEEFTEIWDKGNPCLFMVKTLKLNV